METDKQAPVSYTSTAKRLHWVMALLIVVLWPVGKLLDDLPNNPTKLKVILMHKWFGLLVMALAVIRLVWRLSHRPPEPPPMPAWQTFANKFTHAFFYLLFVLVPLTGWLHSSAMGYPVVWFGVLPLPDLVDKNRPLGRLFGEWHESLTNILLILFIVHVAAALKHHFWDKDHVLRSMTR